MSSSTQMISGCNLMKLIGGENDLVEEKNGGLNPDEVCDHSFALPISVIKIGRAHV